MASAMLNLEFKHVQIEKNATIKYEVLLLSMNVKGYSSLHPSLLQLLWHHEFIVKLAMESSQTEFDSRWIAMVGLQHRPPLVQLLQ